MFVNINHKISELTNIEQQPDKTALFIGDYHTFANKYPKPFYYDKIEEFYQEYFINYDKVIIPITSPKDTSFFNHCVDLFTMRDDYKPIETYIECYTSDDFFDLNFEYQNDRLMCVSDSVKIVHNNVIQRLPFDRRTPVFHEFVISLLKDQVKVITIDNF